MTTSFKYFLERQSFGDEALLVNFSMTPSSNIEGSTEEFAALAKAADFNVVDTLNGHLCKIDSKYFMGKGKAQTLADLTKQLKIKTVLINHELTPAQVRNLEKLCQSHVMTRIELILNIFSKRASTFEGKLQVELAHLKHLTTRLLGGWTHLERQRGGIGLRGGAGEKQLEMDRRSLNQRIHTIQKRLQKVSVQRAERRRTRHRSNTTTIALVGYTNAGKSTLFNTLTQGHSEVKDQLFATLDPTIKQLKLPYLHQTVIVDTVGFIQDLPHELVAAFRATLEETTQAHLLLHVIDTTHKDVQASIDSVDEVLTSIHAHHIPTLLVYNKIDAHSHFEPKIDYDQTGCPRRVWISAKNRIGIDHLIRAMTERLTRDMYDCCIILPPQNARLRSQLYVLNVVKTETVTDQGDWQLMLKIRKDLYQRLGLSQFSCHTA